MKKSKFQQCKMVRKTENGFVEKVSYIPVKFANENEVLKLKNEQGEWENGWKVIGVYGEPGPEPEPPTWAIRTHRGNTGDSIPKPTEEERGLL